MYIVSRVTMSVFLIVSPRLYFEAISHSLDFFGDFFGLGAVVFFTEPFGRPRGRFGPVGLGGASFFFVEPLGRPRPLFTTGSPDSPSAGAGFSLGGRPRFFGLALTTSSTSGILIERSFPKSIREV